jgi:hypothetical protein
VTWQVPSAWVFFLLTLGAYRLTRFVGWDSITEPARALVTGRHETGSGKDARDTDKGRKTRRYRPKVDELLHCPYCVSWWLCVAGFLAWQWWPHAVEVLAVPWAASGIVGLISKVLDA